MVLRMGPIAAKSSAVAAVAAAHPLDTKTQAKATDLTSAANLVTRAQLIAFYLALKAKLAASQAGALANVRGAA